MTDFQRSLPMLLYYTLDGVMPMYRALFARHGVTEQQWRVLRVIWTHRNVTSRDLVQRTLISAPSLVSIIDRLEAKGLVTRVRSVADRRAVHVVATAQGRALQKRVMPEVSAIDAELRDRVSEDEWDALEATLHKLAACEMTAEEQVA